ncbi:hypothetical protein CPB84DRAFT_1749224 [Gymnopilus junonius]|uniref:Uncharacterized protein n=1 Tax=Gymnopilus junonius TaxID=109634 RepID=A0A9P5NID6_GYMJU|nr:hypothetical protein CPB84DRAFT_1749224 [Gymnopilus junonius]
MHSAFRPAREISTPDSLRMLLQYDTLIIERQRTTAGSTQGCSYNVKRPALNFHSLDKFGEVQQIQAVESIFYQIGKVNAGLLAWTFCGLDECREILTDTGKYRVQLNALELSQRSRSRGQHAIVPEELNLDARALILISIISHFIPRGCRKLKKRPNVENGGKWGWEIDF